MAELAGSIVGLVGFAAKVSKLLCGYYGEARDAPEDSKQLASEISSLAGLLEPLSTAAEASRISQTPDSEWMSQSVHEFREILEHLEGKLPRQISEQSDSRTRRAMRSFGTHVTWPFKKGDIQKQIQKIERLKASVTMKLQLDQGRQQEDRERRQRDLEQRQNVERILEWISSERPGKRHADLQSKRKQGIGNWLLETPEFVNWKVKDPCSVLLGRGIAGAGKTYLSSVVIDHLDGQRNLKGFGVGHIYFEYQEQKQQTVLAVLASLVKQLSSQVPPTEFPKDIEVKYQSKKTQHASANDLMDMLLSMPKWFSQVFVICDALDETDQQEQRTELLPLFHQMKASGIALFLTTRPHPADIQDSFQDASTIELSPKEQDIRRYVEERLLANTRFQRIQQNTSGLMNQVVSKIVDSAAGIFLLAKFNVDYILEFGTVLGIKEALDGFSTSERENEQRMDETYDRIIGSICKKPRGIQKYAYRALSWIGYATRTLTVQELLVAIFVEANQYHLDDGDMIRFEDLLDYCNGLVISEGHAVRLVHFSVRNYIDRHQVLPEDAKEMYHAIACCTYLSFDRLHYGYSLNRVDLEASFPFLDYAANSLTFHLSKVERRHHPETTSAVMKLLESQGHRRVYCMIKREIGQPRDVPRLNLACAIGYEDAVRKLLEEGKVDINSKGSPDGLTSLSWAVLMGNEAVVKRLLSEDKLDWSYDGAALLLHAIERRRAGIVWLLLEKGVEVNSSYDESALFLLLAESKSKKDPLDPLFLDLLDPLDPLFPKLFLKFSKSKFDLEELLRLRFLGISPLFHAVLLRREPIIRLLLENGAKPDFTIKSGLFEGRSPLSVAGERWFEDVMRLLQSFV